MQFESKITPSPFPLPCGERIEVRGEKGIVYNIK